MFVADNYDLMEKVFEEHRLQIKKLIEELVAIKITVITMDGVYRPNHQPLKNWLENKEDVNWIKEGF
jgi:hypothetical protein